MERLVRAELPPDAVIVKMNDDGVTWGPKADKVGCAKVTSVALFAIMCLLPFLFLIQAFRDTQNAMRHGVKKLEKLPADTLHSLRLYREFQQGKKISGRMDKYIELGRQSNHAINNLRVYVHRDVAAKLPRMQHNRIKDPQIHEFYLRAMLDFAYLGLDRTIRGKNQHDLVLTLCGMLFASKRMRYWECYDAALGKLESLIVTLTGETFLVASIALKTCLAKGCFETEARRKRVDALVDVIETLRPQREAPGTPV